MAAVSERGSVGAPERPERPERRDLESLIKALALSGPDLVREAVRAYGSIEAAFRRLAADHFATMSPSEQDRVRGYAKRALEIVDALGIHVITRDSARYPSRLLHLPDPPFALFARGRLELLERPMIAVVGTRACTDYGRDIARRMAWGIASSGAVVLSGLARGIDGEAHRAAGPERTVAVVGSGPDVAFPRAHQSLQEAIASEGLLLSEHIPGTPPLGFHFRRRNRILAGLALGVVVVEAPHRSGALSTAAQAREIGRKIFAVPGSIHSEASAGTNALIRDGAQIVTCAREVLEDDVLASESLGAPAPESEYDVPPSDLYGVSLALWRVLGDSPRHVDQVASEVGLEPHDSLASLLALEVMGHVRQLPGMRFIREPRGVPTSAGVP